MEKSIVILLSVAMFVICMGFVISDDKTEDDKVDEETLEYARGSLCGYCTYCKVG